MTAMRIGVVPCQSSSVARFTSQASRALDLGASGVFAYDHLLVRSLGAESTVLPWPMALGAVRATLGSVAVGPLVARCGVGNDPRIIQSLEALAKGGEVVATLGVGDVRGRREHASLGLPWPPREERIASLLQTAAHCHAQSWETFVATASLEVLSRCELGVGVHCYPKDAIATNPDYRVAVSLWGGEPTSGVAARGRDAGWVWLVVAQKSDEPDDDFLARVADAVAHAR